ncbi:MAG TPA: nuclear transport factor 2 family protein [Thermoanaerobaculia bacterium]|nr:nuclear transport factor 2 family protein [Thermoanaerobaculia bacterium]
MLALVLGLVALSPVLHAQGPAPEEKVLLEVEARRRDAIRKGDVATLKQVYAEDFRGIVGNGSPIERAELLEILAKTDPKASFDADEISVRVFGDAAVVTGRLTGTAPGAPTTVSRYVHVYVKRGSAWQCVFGQSTPLK